MQQGAFDCNSRQADACHVPHVLHAASPHTRAQVREAISAAVGDAPFLHAKVAPWSANIVEGCLKRLAALNKPFKFVTTCSLVQKVGAGLHASSCTRWADKTDGRLTVQWESATMMALVTVYWLAI